jgi:hypothetical protein
MIKLDQRAILLGLGAVAAIALVVGLVLKAGSDEKTHDGTTTSVPKEGATQGADDVQKTGGESEAEKTPTRKAPKITTIVVRDGEPVGGVADLDYGHGEQVRFRVTSDIGEEIHLHGYDISKEVKPGGSVTFDFPADLEGVFEVELEGQATQIAELTVDP